MDKVIRILVANRPRVMRELLLATLAERPDIEIVGEVSSEAEIPGVGEEDCAGFAGDLSG